MKPEHVVLLTGAAGAVGRPLLEELLRCPDVARVVALEHADPLSPRDRVTIVRGDVTSSGLGLAAADAARLTGEVTAILHAAADTRFDRRGNGDTQHFAKTNTLQHGGVPFREMLSVPVSGTNVTGARNVVDFAQRCPRLDRIVALSTTHVAGRRTGCILEEELEHEEGFVNAYEASKYEAELEWRRRMTDLPISVCRLSTVIGDSTTGTIARQGAIHHAVRLMYAGLAPMIPGREDSPVDFIAADHAARAIAALTTTAFGAGRTWHLCAGGDTIPAGELIDLTLDGFRRCRPAWRKRTIERPAIVDLDTFDLFCRSAEQAGDTTLRAAAGMMAAFAPQLAYPKRFDDRHFSAALRDLQITAPPARDTWTRVVEQIVGAAA